jgi:hypothetical protein
MLDFDKLRGTSLRLMLLIGLVIVSVIPVRSWASAQSGPAAVGCPFPHYISMDGPGQRAAFSSAANAYS